MGANHWQPWENLFLHEVAGQMPVSLIAENWRELNVPFTTRPLASM